MKNTYVKSLDGLRAIAVLVVMSFHAQITHFGWAGVQLFFVLSGFLITGILWNEKYADTAVGYKLKKFWVRRTLRIFPLYFTYLLLLCVFYLLFHLPGHYPDHLVALFTYTFNLTKAFPHWHSGVWQGDPAYSHLWSLSIEEQFYLLFPLIVFLCPAWLVRGLMIGIIFLAPLIRWSLCQYYTHIGLPADALGDTIYWNTLTHLDAFFLGGIIPVMGLDRRIRRPVLLFASMAGVVFVAGLVNFATSRSGSYYFNDLGYNYAQTAHYEYVWHYSVLSLFFASLILLLVSEHAKGKFSRLLKAFLEDRRMVRIGKVSYGIYIFHWGILAYFYNPFFHSDNLFKKVLLFIPYAIIVYIVAELSFTFYESWFIKWKDIFFGSNKVAAPRAV
jgi:peptidoglycan/LPS O-acetylase OafA/YrhL